MRPARRGCRPLHDYRTKVHQSDCKRKRRTFSALCPTSKRGFLRSNTNSREAALAVIEASFGNFDDFNKDVRTVFGQAVRVRRVRKLRNAVRTAKKDASERSSADAVTMAEVQLQVEALQDAV